MLGGRRVGGFGSAACFSLNPLKNLHAYGDGGVITTDDEVLYQRLLRQRNHGLIDREQCEFFSFNCRLDELQAANRLAQAADAANPTPEADTATAITTLQAENTALRAEAAALREWASTMATRLANLAEDPALA